MYPYSNAFKRIRTRFTAPYRVQRRPVRLELGGGCCGTTWDQTREAVYLLVHRAQCRGEYVKDLEIGAVDELLVGVSVVRDKDKGRKPPVGFLLSFETLHFIVTNNNSLN